MTLAILKRYSGKLFLFADTRLSRQGMALPPDQGTLKTAFVAPHIAVAFSHSSELASRDINEFRTKLASLKHADVVSYFCNSSADSNNEYLIGFADTAATIKISGGVVERSLSQTQWIGDEQAFDRFRSFERGAKFDLGGPWAMSTWGPLEWLGNHSDAFGKCLDRMTAVHQALDIPSTGDFLTAATNVDGVFKYVLTSRLFYDGVAQRLPMSQGPQFIATGENRSYRYSGLVPKEPGVNAAGFYFPQGQIAYIYYAEAHEAVASQCRKIKAPTTAAVLRRCKEELGLEFDFIETAHSC